MPHSTGQQIARRLLAVLTLSSPLLAQGSEVELAPVVDLNPRHHEAASASPEEPKSLVVAAEAIPLRADALPPAVRAAAPFDPTAGTHPQQEAGVAVVRRAAATLAPVIRVYEPIRPAQRPRFKSSKTAAATVTAPNKPLTTPRPNPEPVHRSVFVATRSDRLQRANPPSPQPVQRQDLFALRMLATLDSLPRSKPATSTTDGVPRRSGIIQIAERDPVTRAEQPSAAQQQTPDLAATRPERSSPVVLLATNPLVSESETVTTPPLIQFADAEPLLAILQRLPSTSDLPAPAVAPPLTEEQIAIAEEIDAFELDIKPITELSVRTRPEAGEMPRNYATARFAREGEVAHHMGFSRTQMETTMMWEAPASRHRPLYFEEINLERHGYKVPVIQPALSAAHFFGRVPLLPYMMVSEGHRKCHYTLGHYRPGDYAPYSLYIPRLRLDASAAEAAAIAGVFFIFP